MSDHHNTALIAHSDICAVERCRDCGTIHLHLGSATVRIPPAGLAALCETLLSALSSVPELTPEEWPLPRGH